MAGLSRGVDLGQAHLDLGALCGKAGKGVTIADGDHFAGYGSGDGRAACE